MEQYIQLTADNIEEAHICCAITDKKCKEGYEAKKTWLKQAFKQGYVFKRLDARAKVFIEYGPAEYAWLPIVAPNYININCFWVSGKYKKQGHGRQLLQFAWDAAQAEGKLGLVTVVGTKKFHFMSDTKWLLKQGFQEAARTATGFSLLYKPLVKDAPLPQFAQSAQQGKPASTEGLVAYYSDRCPFNAYHVHHSLVETAFKRNLKLEIIHLDSLEAAQNAPSPATIFSLFKDGDFITTNLSVCMDGRFDKIMEKA